MLDVARARTTAHPVETVHADLLGWEPQGRRWPVVLANFGALNCIAPEARTAERLANLVEPGGYLAAVVMGPFCLWETAYFALHADARAFRRCAPCATVICPSTTRPRRRCGRRLPLVREAAPATGIGVFESPSYAFHLHARWPRLFDTFARIARTWPFNRIADHYLLTLQRTH